MRGIERSRAFTLIEAMAVVVIVSILALVAAVSYRAWIRSAYMAEPQDMLAHIRAAEDAFHAENGTYLNVSGGLDSPQFMYPAQTPGSFKTGWAGPCSGCKYQWSQLNVQSSASVAFAYAILADNSGGAPPSPLPTSGGPAPDYSALQGAPWYIAEAKGDINGDGVFTRVYASSASPRLFVDNEGN
jgi:prepilin-type N-terminal cleavage/methylation domain-containing protein